MTSGDSNVEEPGIEGDVVVEIIESEPAVAPADSSDIDDEHDSDDVDDEDIEA